MICRLTVIINVQAEIDPLGKNKKTWYDGLVHKAAHCL